MNIDDYEQLPTTSVATNMTAGAIAGVLEHCVMYPLDSVKVRVIGMGSGSHLIEQPGASIRAAEISGSIYWNICIAKRLELELMSSLHLLTHVYK